MRGAGLDKAGLGRLIGTFTAMRPRLVALAHARLGSRALAEDLVQDTWLKLESARSTAPVENPVGFIAQVARNVVRDHFRKEGRRAELDAEIGALLGEGADDLSAERRLIARQRLQAVEAALAELPEKTRRIFLMNRIGNIPHRRIAEMLEMSDEAVYYHIRRTLEHLARLRDDKTDA